MPPTQAQERPEDPVLRSSRREALLVFLVWALALTYTVTYCYRNGYDRDPATLCYIWGFPDWVFWGILAPWFGCLLFSYLFGYFIMKDADLGTECLDDEEALDA
jgi:hypothetical protein